MVAVDKDLGYMGAFIMDTWTENSVSCTFVVENPIVLKHGLLKAACSYVFEERGKKKAFVQVASNNLKSLKFVKHIGFIEQYRLKDAFKDGVDCVILELVKANCKYLLDEVA